MSLCAVAKVDGREDPFYFIPVADEDAFNDFMVTERIEVEEEVTIALFERHIDANEFMGGRFVVNPEAFLEFGMAVCALLLHEQWRANQMREAQDRMYDQHLW